MYQHDSKDLNEVSKVNPCPICGKSDWCFVGDDVAICGRVDLPPAGWKQIKFAADGRPIFKQESPENQSQKKIININRKGKKSSPAPIPQIKLCELPADREPSPQPTETALLREPKKAGENADNFEDITYRYSDSQWVVRTQWIDPDHPKGRDKTYCQWHLDNGKAIAKKGEKVWPAYRIEEAIAALSRAENGNAIVWVEGEPNVETLRTVGLAAVTLMGSSWQTEAIEDALLSFIHENSRPVVVIDLIESDKPGLGKKDKLRSVCAERSIPYVRLFPCDFWPEKPVEIPSESADVTNIVSAIGAEEFYQRLNDKLESFADAADDATDDDDDVTDDETEPARLFHSKLNRKRVQIERGLGHRLSYNEFKKRIELDDEPICEDLDDQGGAKLFIAEQLDIDIADADAVAILNRAAKKRRYHPVRDYLEECAARYGNDTRTLDGMALRYFGTTEPIHQTYLIKHLIGSVKRIFEPGCKHDSMLILKGDQGVRKSTWFRVLYGDDNFTDSVLGTEERDSLMALTLYWACEYGEFETITSKKDVSQLKSWLARNKDDYRAPYAKTVRAHPRTFVLVGSTNRDDFLRDETGSRRFMVIPVLLPFIPIEQLLLERDRIWGAAVALYRAGVSSDLSRTEMRLQKLINEDYSQVDPWGEIIASYLDGLPGGEFISTRTILEKAIGIEPRQMDSQATRRCNAILTQMGWKKERKRHQGIQQWGWIAPVPDVPDEDEAIAQHPAQAATRISQDFQPSVPDVPIKNHNELFLVSAQQNEGDHLEQVSQQTEIEIEKVQSEKHPAHPAQEPQTIANNESEPVPDVVIGSTQASGTGELKVGMRVAITCPDAWKGEKGTIARAKNWMGRVEYWFVAMDKGGERKYPPQDLRKMDEQKEGAEQLDLLSSAALEPGDYLEDVDEDEDEDDRAVNFDSGESAEVENIDRGSNGAKFAVGDRVILGCYMHNANPGELGVIRSIKGEKNLAIYVDWDSGETSFFKRFDALTRITEEARLENSDRDSVSGMAISLWQPWASLLARIDESTGLPYKGFETRSWKTDYRGKLIIHAAKKQNLELRRFSDRLAKELGIKIDFDGLPRGCAIATCDLVDCIEMTEEFIAQQSKTEIACGEWSVGRYAWKLENIQPFPEPIPMKGQQGLWRVNRQTTRGD